MRDLSSTRDHLGVREGLLLLGIAAVLVGVDVALAPGAETAASAALAARGVAGVFFLVAALFVYLEWRVRPAAGKGWLVVAVVLLACQLLGSAAMALDPMDTVHRRTGWPVVVDLAVTGVVVGLAALALTQRPHRGADPLLTGLCLGAAGTLAKPALHALDVGMPVDPTVLVGAIIGGYAALGCGVLVRHSMPRGSAWRLAVTLALVSGAHAAASPRFPSAELDIVSGALLVVAGALWAGATHAMLRASLDDAYHRAVQLESSLLEVQGADRGNREALHELKATIAGLSKASELLADAALPTEMQQRLQQSLIRELARLERRLWAPDPTDAGVVDLDVTLDTVLDLHRARGRVFAWTPTGESVFGNADAISEAVNILLDNAATHGDATTGRVEVGPDDTDADMVRIAVCDEGPGVPKDMRHRIFEWGERSASSAGQGIGLHVARRLVDDLGGSLTLSDVGAGSSFVIRLPAARRSEEMLGARAELPAG